MVTINTILTAQPELELLGSYAQAEGSTELIKVCQTCYAPPHYIPLFLVKPLTPWATWDWVWGQVALEGQEVGCHALVRYLQAAPIHSVEGALALADPPMAPLTDMRIFLVESAAGGNRT